MVIGLKYAPPVNIINNLVPNILRKIYGNILLISGLSKKSTFCFIFSLKGVKEFKPKYKKGEYYSYTGKEKLNHLKV